MPKRYYLKELPQSAVYISGHPFKFDILETEDPGLISQLDACVARHVGGVMAITKEQFEVEAQKKTSGIICESGPKQKPPTQRNSELSTLHALHAAGASDRMRAQPSLVAGPNDSKVSGRPMPDPISVPSPNSFSGLFAKPKTAKASDVKSTVAAVSPRQ